MVNIPIFLYSKYCKQCPELINHIDPNQFLFVCVDNVEVRKKFLNDQRFLVRTVPCIIVYNDDNNTIFEKYEGNSLIDWLDENNLLITNDKVNQAEDDEEEELQHKIPITPLPIEESFIPPNNVMENNNPEPIMESNNSVDEEAPAPIEDPSGMSDQSAIPKKSSDVMNLAQQMQRERDNEGSKTLVGGS